MCHGDRSALDAAQRPVVLPKEKIAGLLDETSQAVGGLGLGVDSDWSTAPRQSSATSSTNINDVNDIINNSAPIIDSQSTGRRDPRWAANLTASPHRPPRRTGAAHG